MNGLLQKTTDAVAVWAEWLRTSPEGQAMGQKALEDRATAIYAERLAIVRDITRIETADLEQCREHERRIGPVAARIAELEKQLAEQRDDWQRLDTARREDAFSISQQLDRLRGRLSATAPRERISEFISEMRDELDALRLNVDQVKEICIDGVHRVTWNNHESIWARKRAISANILAARALDSEALDDAALVARLTALRSSLPSLEERPSKYLR